MNKPNSSSNTPAILAFSCCSIVGVISNDPFINANIPKSASIMAPPNITNAITFFTIFIIFS